MREALVINQSKRLLCEHPELVLWANPVGHGYLTQAAECPCCHQPLPGRRVTFGLRPGSGDYIGIGDGGRFVSVEFKATGKRPRPDQRQWMDLIRARGGFAEYVDSVSRMAAVVAAVKEGKVGV